MRVRGASSSAHPPAFPGNPPRSIRAATFVTRKLLGNGFTATTSDVYLRQFHNSVTSGLLYAVVRTTCVRARSTRCLHRIHLRSDRAALIARLDHYRRKP